MVSHRQFFVGSRVGNPILCEGCKGSGCTDCWGQGKYIQVKMAHGEENYILCYSIHDVQGAIRDSNQNYDAEFCS